MRVVICLFALAAAELRFNTSLNVTGTLTSDSLTTDQVITEKLALIEASLSADSVKSIDVVSDGVTLNSLSAERVVIEGDLMIVQAAKTSSFIELGRNLHSHSDFEKGADGWTGAHTDDCLGTHIQSSCSSPTVHKSFTLPVHNELIIEASFHMLGEWLNDTAFLKVDDAIVWMENGQTNTLKTCREGFDARIGVPISVKLPHSSRTAIMEFGTTLETCSGSFSVDEVRVYVR